ncbi:TolC family protein [Chitinophaga sp. Cy-1792]|uniref:TolC family protein n=1 Tax=Chitinophaga sp. Cy-1792 TaxID=2608339 RepID=UPI0014210DFD|nr:TolC family protein [Chitinophaga sp. Cy-1792]
MYQQYKKMLLLLMLAGIGFSSQAQTDTGFIHTDLALNQYLGKVGKQNLGYIATQYDVSIAEAGIESAKVFPDPELSLGYFDNQQATLQLGRGYNAALSTTFELGGKRPARIGLAKSQAELSKALLQDYFRNLRADAALAYYNALQQYYQYKVLTDSYRTMKQLADADSIRFKLGAIMEVDARQSKLEAGTLLNTLYQGEADWKTSLVQLNLFMGKEQRDTLALPVGDFENLNRDFPLMNMIDNAQNNRADVVAAKGSKTVAEKTLRLAKANRKIDLGVNAGLQFNGESTNEIAPTPAYRSVSAGIAIPLKFSNTYKGELKAAKYTLKQSEVQYQEVLLQISTEVTQAYMNYEAARKQVAQYRSGLMTEAEKVLEGKIYSYKRGETSLLEVLNAQRTYNDVQQNYYQAQYNYAAALINLERSAGIWDLQ